MLSFSHASLSHLPAARRLRSHFSQGVREALQPDRGGLGVAWRKILALPLYPREHFSPIRNFEQVDEPALAERASDCGGLMKGDAHRDCGHVAEIAQRRGAVQIGHGYLLAGRRRHAPANLRNP
ncbi:MAG: hypothetical protein ABSC25_24360 [Roseiarcus sp.]